MVRSPEPLIGKSELRATIETNLALHRIRTHSRAILIEKLRR